MAMFDDVEFAYRMPDGYEGGNFQTKDFHCLMDVYEITPTGRLVRTRIGGWTDEAKGRPLGDTNFSGMLNVYRFSHEYDLEFVNGSLVAIHCQGQAGRLIFDPSNCLGS